MEGENTRFGSRGCAAPLICSSEQKLKLDQGMAMKEKEGV